jgi:hypothetical protein
MLAGEFGSHPPSVRHHKHLAVAVSAACLSGGHGVLGKKDFYLFNEGSHYGIYEKLGAHPCLRDGRPGTQFAVWATGGRARARPVDAD